MQLSISYFILLYLITDVRGIHTSMTCTSVAPLRPSYQVKRVTTTLCSCSGSCVMDLDVDVVLGKLTNDTHNAVMFRCSPGAVIEWRNIRVPLLVHDVSIQNCHLSLQSKPLFAAGTRMFGILLRNTNISTDPPTFSNWTIITTVIIISKGMTLDPDDILNQIRQTSPPVRYNIRGVLTRVPARIAGSIETLILDVSSNYITERGLLSNNQTYNCQTLTLNKNMLRDLRNYSFKGSVRFLFIQNAEMKQFGPKTFRELLQLTELHLDGNKIATLPHDAFRGLVLSSLTMENNQLISLEGLSLNSMNTNLLYLNFGRNLLTDIPERLLGGLEQLDHLALHDNHLTMIPMSVYTLCGLTSVRLSNNSIDFMKTITALAKLQYPECARARLLHLDHNNLDNFLPKNKDDRDTLRLSFKHTYYVLQDNDVKCDCSLIEFFNNVTSHSGYYRGDNYASTIKCSSPGDIRGRRIKSLASYCELTSGSAITSARTSDMQAGMMASSMTLLHLCVFLLSIFE